MANLSNINNILRVSSSGVGLNKNNTGPSELDIESSGADMIDMTRTGQKTYRFAISGASAFSLFDVAANADRLTIDSSGNSTFAGALNVNGNATLANYSGTGENYTILAQNSYGQMRAGIRSGVPYIGSISSLPLDIYTGNSSKIRIQTDGNVGIGTTSPDLGAISGTRVLTIASPETERWGILELAGNRTWGGNQVGELKFISTDSTNNGTLVSLTAINDPTSTGTGGSLKFSTRPNGGSLTERMRIDSSGFGYFYNRFYLASAANQGNLFFGTADSQYNIFGGGTYGYMGYNTSGYHRFLASGTERMRITSAGDILCTSDGGSDAFRVFNPGTGAGDIYLRVEKAYTSAAVGRAAGIILGSNAGNLGSTWTMEATSQLGYFSGADLAFTHNSGGTASRRVTFKDGGNVGIGTDSPGVKLEVNGSTRIGGNNYGHQTVFASKAAAGNNVGVDVMFVGHTHSLDVNVMVVLDGAQAAVGRGYTLSSYGFATATLTQTKVSGNMVGVSITYVNSGGSENYVLRVTPTYAGSTNPTIYLTVNGQSNSIVRTAT